MSSKNFEELLEGLFGKQRKTESMTTIFENPIFGTFITTLIDSFADKKESDKDSRKEDMKHPKNSGEQEDIMEKIKENWAYKEQNEIELTNDNLENTPVSNQLYDNEKETPDSDIYYSNNYQDGYGKGILIIDDIFDEPTNCLEIRFSLPGIEKKDVRVKIDNNKLMVWDTLLKFEYLINLGLSSNLDYDNINTQYNNGELRLEIPYKLQEDKIINITVN